MNALLQKKLDELKNAQEFECWYLVKHSTNFGHLCYLVSFLKDYIEHPGSSRNLESHIEKKVQAINAQKPSLGLSNNYRALRVAAFFGLIKMTSSKYEECVFTDTFYEVDKKCGGEYEKTELYQDIITRQIEKMFVSSSIDEGKNSIRRNFAIFPIMFLNKVLLEMGKVTGSYSISMIEYRYLVATTKRYEDYLETMLYIKLLRDEPSVSPQFEAMRGKFDNRMNKAIELLDYLECDNNKIVIKKERIQEVARKVYAFEANKPSWTDNKYIDFLCSTKSLFEAIIEDGDKTAGSDVERAVLQHWENKDFFYVDATPLYEKFREMFGEEKIRALEGKDLLYSLFGTQEHNSLVYNLEFSPEFDYFGGVGAGPQGKTVYTLYFQNGDWKSCTNAKNIELIDEATAIEKATKYRDAFLDVFAHIKQLQDTKALQTTEQYSDLALYLKEKLGVLYNRNWAWKYLHMMFPDVFINMFSPKWVNKIFRVAQIVPASNYIQQCKQFSDFSSRLGIMNVYTYHILDQMDDADINEEELDDASNEDIAIKDQPYKKRLTGGENVILYGVPGAGKSYTIKHEYCQDENCIERLVFHPDYTYSDFVGQILPHISEGGSVSYEFTPGPFTKLLRKAYINPEKMFYLVIEEVNRGNAPAIFGDVFQLLDRDEAGNSEYKITNADIAKIVYENDAYMVSIPSNMSILCTMNTSDQNVFTLDTAFQRRWNMRLIKNKFGDAEEEKKFAGTKILDTDVTWEHFFTEINNIILSKNIRMTSSEDKRLGTHFVAEEDLEYLEGNERHNRKFPEKVLKYLWDDAFKFTKEDIFDLEKVKSLEDVIELFIGNEKNERFRVFKENIYKTLVPQQA